MEQEARVTAIVFPHGVTGPQASPAYVTAPTIGDISGDHIGEAVTEAIKNYGRPFPASSDTVVLLTFTMQEVE